MAYDISQLRKFVTPEIIFGAGSRKTVANYVNTFAARKVLLVSDSGVVAAGWVADVEHSLQQQGVDYVLYTGVSANPRVEEVMQGAELYRASACEDRKSTRLNSSHVKISYAVFCLKKKRNTT